MELRIGKQADAVHVREVAYSAMHSFGLTPDPKGIDIELGRFGEKLDILLLQLVACEGNKVTGCISLSRLDSSIGKLSGFYVDASYHGQGIGKKLIARVIDHAKSISLNGIYLETWDSMVAAIHLYTKFGWNRIADPPKESGAQRAYYLELSAQ